MKVKILVPVYNDWQSVYKLLDEIDNLQLEKNFEISILIVNDASNHDRPEEEKIFDPGKIYKDEPSPTKL